MKNANKERRSLGLIAKDYFQYLGRHLPQECANDEFYFFPRSETAVDHLDVLDDLDPDKITDHVQCVRALLRELSLQDADGLEEEIDGILLRQSMQSFIREFEDAKVWQVDPTLYVKIPLFATDQVLSQIDFTKDNMKRDLLTLLDQIPHFLNLAAINLHAPSEISLEVAGNMVHDALHYYSQVVRTFIMESLGESKELLLKNSEVQGAWERYGKGLRQLASGRSFAVGDVGLGKILSVSFNYPKSPEEILESTQYAQKETLERLRSLAREIDKNRKWEHIIYERLPSVPSGVDVMEIYEKEVQGLRRFFSSQAIVTFPLGEKLTVLQTPSYLKSLRATASYRAPLTGDAEGHGIFYITPGKEDLEMIVSHCPYLSAHETYPGHHLLDYFRIHHPNSIRRQIESPLFYEGWACYAEQLLDEFGYVEDPRKQLIQLKRQLWRDLRAILDIKLQTGKITLSRASEEIQALGFSPRRAQRQVRRFCLTPGYQLCYSVGMHEILRLRKRFSSRLPIKIFHDTLIGGGQIPFHHVEKRMEACPARK